MIKTANIDYAADYDTDYEKPLKAVSVQLYYLDLDPLPFNFILIKPGLLKLWVSTLKWVPEPSQVGRENASSKNIIIVIISVS